MTDNTQDKDKNLEQFFEAKKRQAIPPEILEGYTQSVMQRLHGRSPAWKLVALPALGLAMAATLIFAFWPPRPSSVTTSPAPTLPAIERDAAVLDQVSPADLPPLPAEDLLPQMEMLDSFTVAMESKKDRLLTMEEEAQVLMAVGADNDTYGEPTPQELETLDDLESRGQV